VTNQLWQLDLCDGCSDKTKLRHQVLDLKFLVLHVLQHLLPARLVYPDELCESCQLYNIHVPNSAPQNT